MNLANEAVVSEIAVISFNLWFAFSLILLIALTCILNQVLCARRLDILCKQHIQTTFTYLLTYLYGTIQKKTPLNFRKYRTVANLRLLILQSLNVKLSIYHDLKLSYFALPYFRSSVLIYYYP